MEKILGLKELGVGVGQNWQDVTTSRQVGVTYTNTTGKAICISVYNNEQYNNGTKISISINNQPVVKVSSSAISYSRTHASIIVPSGATYSVTEGLIDKWFELR